MEDLVTLAYSLSGLGVGLLVAAFVWMEMTHPKDGDDE